MHKALKKVGKDTDLVLYEDTAHQIWRDSYRIDMLSKIDKFLTSSIGSKNGGNAKDTRVDRIEWSHEEMIRSNELYSRLAELQFGNM